MSPGMREALAIARLALGLAVAAIVLGCAALTIPLAWT